MKPVLNQWIALFSVLFLLALPQTLLAGTSMLVQDITISFTLDRAYLLGTSRIILPRDMDLHLYLGGLEQVQISISPSDDAGSTEPDQEKTLVLAPAPFKRTLSISWQLTAPSGTMSNNLISSRGITLAGQWHPVADRDMLFSLTATLPADFSGVTEADTLVLQQSGNKDILKAKYPHPLRSINFAAGPYTVRSRKIGTTTVYTYFFKEDANLSSGYLEKAAGYIKRYERLLGPFPFARYSIVENRLPTGYGMPTFTLLGQAVLRLPFIKDTSLGHEILHSWFGNALRLDGTGNWCEGLTTYLADQSYAEDRGEGIEYRKQQLMRYQSFVHPGNITTLIDFHHGGDSGPLARKMRAIGYDKASMVFSMLNQEVGDQNFYTALRQLYTENKYEKIGWTDLETAFSRVAGRDLSLFFGQWLLRNDIPELSIEEPTIDQKKGESVISFRIKQQNKAPYRLQIPVRVQTLDGSKTTMVKVDSPDQLVSVTVDALPEKLSLDPECRLMRVLQPAEQYPAWVRVMGAEKKILVLPRKEERKRFQPLITKLERSGWQSVEVLDLKNSALAENTVIFLGSSRHSRGIFGRISHPEQGFTLDVRTNPLNPEHCMVLISSSGKAETAKVVHKLNHYGKYSYLHFSKGRIREKRITPSANGMDLELLTPPVGIPVRQAQGFNQIIDELLQSRVIYVGEQHTDYSAHILQLQIIQALHNKNPDLIIGMEMFPRTSQQALNDYINGAVTDERAFLKASDYFQVWGFDYRLYRDIINYARKHKIPLIGLNLDKQTVSTVFRTGSTDGLSSEQLAGVAEDRDLELPGYRERLQSIHAMHNSSPHGSNFAGFLQAQSMWDETMAESIVNTLKENPTKQMIVLAGIGHVYKDSAIPPRVARRMNSAIRQSVVIADNGVDQGMEQGRQVDYLMFTDPVEMAPAGKIGVVLDRVEATDHAPGQVRIVRISPHGKAGQAGLREDDIILTVNDFPVSSVGDLKAGLLDKKPGDTIVLTIRRQQETMTVPVELSNMDMSAMMMPPGHPK